MKRIIFSLCLVLMWGASTLDGEAAPADSLAWPAVTNECRPWCFWWWMGSAVDPPNLTRELTRYRNAGQGGVHIIPIYGAEGWEDRSIDYLSPEWLAMLEYTIREAHRLGMGVDMTTGTGWCFGGPQVPVQEGGLKVMAKVFDVPAGGTLRTRLDRDRQIALSAFSSSGRFVDLRDQVGPTSRVQWPAGDTAWKVYAVSWKSTGLQVKRAAPGGEGLMINPFYGEAMRHYLDSFTDALASYPGPRPRCLFQDSYEYFGCDWSPDLLDEFARRRGYRLETQFPLLFGAGTDDRTARIKGDYRETLSDLMVEHHAAPWVDWSHRQGCRTRYQAHGSPGNLLDLYAAADIPETEMFHKDREPLVAKFASSAAHVTGKPLASSETGTWLGEHFTVTLDDLKRLVDLFFVSGINHVVYHGTCYSPDEVPWPGWVFYASTQMNPRNSIWRDVPALNAYIARCQSILQSGRPDNDVLLYWPIHDLWHQAEGTVRPLTVSQDDWLKGQPIGTAARLLWGRGYSFDYISDRQLHAARVEKDGLTVAGNRYRAVVVPTTQHMPLETMQTLLALAKDGGTVIIQDQLPADVPGFGHLEQRRQALKTLLAAMKLEPLAGGKLQQARLGRGRVLVGDVEKALAEAGVARETVADHPGVFFIRRVGAGVRHYFICNQGDKELDQWITLATAAESAGLLDPMTGRTGMAAVQKDKQGRTQVYLQLPPGASVLLRTWDHKTNGLAWEYLKRVGSPTPLAGVWQVQFLEGGPELPKPFRTEHLGSWTSQGGTAERFAGTARYTLKFNAPASGDRFLLDLGKVCQSARVRLNGRDYGTLLTAPFQVPVEGVRPRDNVLKVEVSNVSANRIRDLDRRHVNWKTFHDINIVNIDYKPFDASNWPLYDSGLLGAVTLQAVDRLSVP